MGPDTAGHRRRLTDEERTLVSRVLLPPGSWPVAHAGPPGAAAGGIGGGRASATAGAMGPEQAEAVRAVAPPDPPLARTGDAPFPDSVEPAGDRDRPGEDQGAGLGDRFKAGVLIHTGPRTLPFGDRLAAVPVSGLWSAASGARVASRAVQDPEENPTR
jgi:hypothetical protein